jgi:chromosome partitioning protein
MTKVISLFNHKGGVSKTTTTFHLGWMLTKLGLRVLVVDADSQCNLTGLVLGIHDHNSLFEFYAKRGNHDIYNSLATAFGFDSELKDASKEGIHNPTATRNSNMALIAGHVDFAKFDLQIATAMTSSQAIPLLRPLIGSINNLIRKTADKGKFDVVLIDMSPNISATNMCVLMASDYFIIPTSPDFFCYQSIESLSNVLPNWSEGLAVFKDDITLPRNNPKMLGVISQNYRVYNTRTISGGAGGSENTSKEFTKEFRIWADKIRNVTNSKLVPSLAEKGMVVAEELFEKHVQYDTPYNLANIPNFNSLMPASQRLSKPIFELEQEDGAGSWYDTVWEREYKGKMIGVKHNIKKSHEIYRNLADAVMSIMNP